MNDSNLIKRNAASRAALDRLQRPCRARRYIQRKTFGAKAKARRLFQWLSRKLEVAYFLGASEERLEAEERKAGLINNFDNNN